MKALSGCFPTSSEKLDFPFRYLDFGPDDPFFVFASFGNSGSSHRNVLRNHILKYTPFAFLLFQIPYILSYYSLPFLSGPPGINLGQREHELLLLWRTRSLQSKLWWRRGRRLVKVNRGRIDPFIMVRVTIQRVWQAH